MQFQQYAAALSFISRTKLFLKNILKHEKPCKILRYFPVDFAFRTIIKLWSLE
jgi:hypothetical protein